MDGTYTVYAQYYNGYTGEYRLRVSLARWGGMQIESENNNSFAQANVVALTLTGGQRKGSVMGYVNAGEPSIGDYFSLGNLTEGNTITGTRRRVVVRLPARVRSVAGGGGGEQGGRRQPQSHRGLGRERHLLRPCRSESAPPRLVAHQSDLLRQHPRASIPIHVPESAMTVSFRFYSVNAQAGLFQVAQGPLGNNGNDRHVYLSGGNIYARLYSNQTIIRRARTTATANGSITSPISTAPPSPGSGCTSTAFWWRPETRRAPTSRIRIASTSATRPISDTCSARSKMSACGTVCCHYRRSKG